MQCYTSILFQLLANLVANGHCCRLRVRQVEVADEADSKLLWCCKSFMEVPEKCILDTERRKRIRSSVRRKIEATISEAAGYRKGFKRRMSGDLDVNPNGNEGER